MEMQNVDVNFSASVDSQSQADLSTDVVLNQDLSDVTFDPTKTLFLKNKLTTTSI